MDDERINQIVAYITGLKEEGERRIHLPMPDDDHRYEALTWSFTPVICNKILGEIERIRKGTPSTVDTGLSLEQAILSSHSIGVMAQNLHQTINLTVKHGSFLNAFNEWLLAIFPNRPTVGVPPFGTIEQAQALWDAAYAYRTISVTQ